MDNRITYIMLPIIHSTVVTGNNAYIHVHMLFSGVHVLSEDTRPCDTRFFYRG